MKALDLTNQRFGNLVAIKRVANKGRYTQWLCKCDCGRETIVRTDYLRNGHTTSCGCACGRVDITGQVFGYLTAIKQLTGGKWLCKCKCGNEIEVLTYNLKNGNTKSCGCYQKERTSEASLKTLIGQRFGKLQVIEQIKDNNYNGVYYKCQCDCGGITVVSAGNLRKHNTNSCGCLKSKGEMLINNYLQKNNIIFKTQYSHPDIVFESNRHPLFDFAVFNNENKLLCLIEYNGKQHYMVTGGWNDEENFKNTQYRDEQKRSQCKQLMIPLYEIKYDEDIEGKLQKIIQEIKNENV